MKIKKKELRKRLAQLPINYPDPTVRDTGVPGGHLNLEDELMKVEILCKRLAHNEVVIRDACLAEIPKYIQMVSAAVAKMEKDYEPEIREVLQYFYQFPDKPCPYHYDNIIKALKVFREKEYYQDQKNRRKASLRAYKKRKEEEQRAKEMEGKIVIAASMNDNAEDATDEDDENSLEHTAVDQANKSVAALHRERYTAYMRAWCDLELVYLKLCRGLYFCLWHSDKPLVQLECAQRLADLIHAAPTTRTKVLFYASFFRVLAHEWATIDRYRLDKYLALVRRLWSGFVLLARDLEESSGKDKNGDYVVVPPPPSSAKKGTAKKGMKEQSAAPKKDVKGGNNVEKKGTKSAKKRSREETEEAAKATSKNGKGKANDTKGKRVPNNRSNKHVQPVEVIAMEISYAYIKDNYQQSKPLVFFALSEIFYLFQQHIFPNRNSVGLSMHLCDVSFDELNKALLNPTLFVALSAGVPLFAMSQGNSIEKRVLDFFFPPVVGGVLQSKRTELIQQSLKPKLKSKITLRDKDSVDKENKLKSKDRDSTADAELADKLALQQTNEIVQGLIKVCQAYAVSLGTVRSVRVMFSEAMQVMQQTQHPDELVELTDRDLQQRVRGELGEVASTRKLVKEVRQAAKDDKKRELNAKIMEKVREKKKSIKKKTDEDAVDEKKLFKQIKKDELASKKKVKNTRDSKRKKNYKLTSQDLYGDEKQPNSDED